MPHRAAALLCSLLSLLLVACGSGASSSEEADASQPDAALELPDASIAVTGVADAGALDAGAADAGQEPTPADHALMLGGVAHRTGHTDPLTSCSACHGTSLNGGSASSCYSCHDTSDHTRTYRGVPHKMGPDSSCTVCHGPSNGGGLGPACADCH